MIGIYSWYKCTSKEMQYTISIQSLCILQALASFLYGLGSVHSCGVGYTHHNIKHLLMIQISISNNPQGVNMPLNQTKPNQTTLVKDGIAVYYKIKSKSESFLEKMFGTRW